MSTRRPAATAVILGFALMATSCGDDESTAVGVPSTTTTTIAASDEDPGEPTTSKPGNDPIVGCPSGPTFPLSAVDEVPPIDSAPDGVEAAARSFLDNEEGVHWPQEGWRVLHETPDALLLVHVGDRSTAAATGLTFMTIELADDGWRWSGASGGGDCALQFQLDEGLGVVEWQLDPDYAEPAPTDTTVHVLATERACASAQPMGDRLRDPIVLADVSQMSITLSVQPLAGGQDCPDNPSAAVTVDLGEPLGDRRLVDGRAVGVDLEDLLPES